MAPPCWAPSWVYCGFESSHASNALALVSFMALEVGSYTL